MTSLTQTETTFLLYGCGLLLGILAFIGSLAVNALINMARDLREIKITIAAESVRREALEKRIDVIEKKILDER